MNFKNFKIEILVEDDGSKGVLQWSADDLNDVDGLLARLVAELDQLAYGRDWEIVPDPHSPFWGLTPVDLIHKLPGQFASGAVGRIDDEKIKGLIQESQVIVVAQERGLPRHHAQLLQWWVGNIVLINDPVEFAQGADPEQLIEQFWIDREDDEV